MTICLQAINFFCRYSTQTTLRKCSSWFSANFFCFRRKIKSTKASFYERWWDFRVFLMESNVRLFCLVLSCVELNRTLDFLNQWLNVKIPSFAIRFQTKEKSSNSPQRKATNAWEILKKKWAINEQPQKNEQLTSNSKRMSN